MRATKTTCLRRAAGRGNEASPDSSASQLHPFSLVADPPAPGSPCRVSRGTSSAGWTHFPRFRFSMCIVSPFFCAAFLVFLSSSPFFSRASFHIYTLSSLRHSFFSLLFYLPLTIPTLTRFASLHHSSHALARGISLRPRTRLRPKPTLLRPASSLLVRDAPRE